MGLSNYKPVDISVIADEIILTETQLLDKKLVKYFKRKQESPLDILIKLVKKEKSTEKQEILNKDRNDKKSQLYKFIKPVYF